MSMIDDTARTWTLTSIGDPNPYLIDGPAMVVAVAMQLLPGSASAFIDAPLERHESYVPPHINATEVDDWFCETFGAPHVECYELVTTDLRGWLVESLRSVRLKHGIQGVPGKLGEIAQAIATGLAA